MNANNARFQSAVKIRIPGAESILYSILGCLNSNSLKYVVIALESTSFYSTHIANFLSSDETLLAYTPMVFCLNPKTIANYKKSFVDMDKTDPLDAFIIADFARCGRITSQPWRGAQFLALQRLTRHRLYLVESISREKAYMVSSMQGFTLSAFFYSHLFYNRIICFNVCLFILLH